MDGHRSSWMVVDAGRCGKVAHLEGAEGLEVWPRVL